MPTQEIRERVNQRLEELYRRHLSLHDGETANYYNPGIGYYKPDTAEPEQKRFVICLATTDGEVFALATTTGRSPYSPSPRCSSTAWPWRLTGATTFWSGSGWSRAVTRSTPSSSTSETTVRTTR